jgi:hypothetical protein
VPEALGSLGGVALLLGRAAVSRGWLETRDLGTAVALASLAFLLRAAAVNQPGYYYADQGVHAQLVRVVRERGPDLLRDPAHTLWGRVRPTDTLVSGQPPRRAESGLWVKSLYGREAAMPYVLTFHALFAPWPLEHDRLLSVMKLAGAALTAVPPVLILLLARGTGTSWLGALLAVGIPVYGIRLSFAATPALFGHVLDLAFLVWLLPRLERLGERFVWLTGVVLMALSQLAYVAGIVNLVPFMALLALAEMLGRRPGSLRRGLLVLGLGAAASAVALALYYWHFVSPAVRLIWDLLQVGAPASAEAAPQWHELLSQHLRGLFGTPLALMAGVGIVLLARLRSRACVVWLAAYALALLLRAKLPGIFRYAHEALFVAPLVCWAAGEALAVGWGERMWRRVVTVLLVVVILLAGLLAQHQAFAARLGRLS